MPRVSDRRRKPRRRAISDNEAAWVKLENLPGSPGEVLAKIIDASEVAIGVEVSVALEENTYVVVNGHAGGPTANGKCRARVVRCIQLEDGSFNAGLVYEDGGESDRPTGYSEPIIDYYEVLQVNPKADPETIHRVFRLMAQRFHPDNVETGNAEVFRGIMEAYQVLSDPEKRAAYDISLHSEKQVRWKIFDQDDAAIGKRAEVSKRRGILDLLYTARMNQPAHPVMTIHELEELLGCPREHLEFSLWYLREQAYIMRSDNGRFHITAKGVDRAEAEEASRMANDRLITGRQNFARAR
ncbi:MAG TPA: DnaJ domain-containing protein [Bryobacteraceae bacterium]|nr:DnaJ domain-containing protein [Bryobacteraceae bacterium]